MPEQLRPLHRSRQSRHESPEPSRSGTHAFPTCAAHLSAFLWKRNGRGGFRGSGYSREGAHFAANIPMTIHAAPLFPSFLWKEVPRRGGGWPRETVLPHSGKPTPPRFARLPLPEERARMIVYENTLYSKTPRRFPIFMRRTTPSNLLNLLNLLPLFRKQSKSNTPPIPSPIYVTIEKTMHCTKGTPL